MRLIVYMTIDLVILALYLQLDKKDFGKLEFLAKFQIMHN